MTSLQSQQQEKWQKERTEAISEMFDNVREDGIYPTSKFFERIDAAWDATWKAAQEEMIERVREICRRWSEDAGYLPSDLDKDLAALEELSERKV